MPEGSGRIVEECRSPAAKRDWVVHLVSLPHPPRRKRRSPPIDAPLRRIRLQPQVPGRHFQSLSHSLPGARLRAPSQRAEVPGYPSLVFPTGSDALGPVRRSRKRIPDKHPEGHKIYLYLLEGVDRPSIMPVMPRPDLDLDPWSKRHRFAREVRLVDVFLSATWNVYRAGSWLPMLCCCRRADCT